MEYSIKLPVHTIHPQSNGFSEFIVKITKMILTKAQDSKEDLYLALLNYEATPISKELPSPYELMTNRKSRM